MRYVVIVSHGEFASGLHSAINMMTGKRKDVLSLGLLEDMTADQFSEQFQTLIQDCSQDDEIILLADVMSGSPFTNAIHQLDSKHLLDHTLIIAGVNMPMAVTAVLSKDNFESLEQLKETLLSEGQSGMKEFIVSK